MSAQLTCYLKQLPIMCGEPSSLTLGQPTWYNSPPLLVKEPLSTLPLKPFPNIQAPTCLPTPNTQDRHAQLWSMEWVKWSHRRFLILIHCSRRWSNRCEGSGLKYTHLIITSSIEYNPDDHPTMAYILDKFENLTP